MCRLPLAAMLFNLRNHTHSYSCQPFDVFSELHTQNITWTEHILRRRINLQMHESGGCWKFAGDDAKKDKFMIKQAILLSVALADQHKNMFCKSAFESLSVSRQLFSSLFTKSANKHIGMNTVDMRWSSKHQVINKTFPPRKKNRKVSDFIISQLSSRPHQLKQEGNPR